MKEKIRQELELTENPQNRSGRQNAKGNRPLTVLPQGRAGQSPAAGHGLSRTPSSCLSDGRQSSTL